MILQCPNCNSRFLVADALIPPLGRTVRCGACAHQWHVEPAKPGSGELGLEMPAAPVDFATLAEQEATATGGDIPEVVEPRKLPVISPKMFAPKPYRVAALGFAACWLLVAAFAYFPNLQRWPVVGMFYHLAGVRDTSGLVFSDITMEREADGDKTRFVVAGAIANRAMDARHVPQVRVQLKDKKNKVIWSRTYPVDHTVAPGESYPFRIGNVETSFADTTASIVLDLGNPLELAVR